MTTLYLDLGASLIKGFIITDSNEFVDTFQLPSLASRNENSSSSVFLDALANKLKLVCLNLNIQRIFITEEMHGFSILPNISNPGFYYSWRCSWPYESHCQSLFFSKPNFEKKTRMKIRDGYGIWGMYELSLQNPRQDLRFGNLTALLISRLGKWFGSCHIGTLHAQGLIDFSTLSYHDGLPPKLLSGLPAISGFRKTTNIIGEIQFGRKNIPVYGGIGDLIATIEGVVETTASQDVDLIVNSGTGSQLIALNSTNPYLGEISFETRFGYSQTHAVISHIPCGRAIHFYKKIFDGIFPEIAPNAKFWNLFNRDIAENIYHKIPVFSLGIFSSAFPKYFGGVSYLDETTTPEEFVYGLQSALIDQYVDLILKMRPKPKSIIFSGGIFSRNPSFGRIIAERVDCKKNVVCPHGGLTPQTIRGLQVLRQLI